MAKPSFINLQQAYPKVASPCDQPWGNQCAIRMSIALNGERSIRVNNSTYTDPKCKHEHARGAESLANWLWRHHLGRPLIIEGTASARQTIRDKRGIIFFKDCFARASEKLEDRTGDHIDLWNRGITQGFDDGNYMSKKIWFWELP